MTGAPFRTASVSEHRQSQRVPSVNVGAYRHDMLRVRLLGGLSLERDGIPLPPPVGRAPTALLGYLALNPGHHDREALAARFWADVPESSARANLRTAVWTLRKAIGDGSLAADRRSVGLVGTWVDVIEVAAMAERGEQQAAIELCRGDLLPEEDADWAEPARVRHHACHAGLLEALATKADNAGRLADAVNWSRQRCALTPLDEPAVRALLQRLLAAGDRADAVRAGQEFVATLRDTLGVAPDAETKALLAELREPEPRAHRPTVLPMFGRANELAALNAMWAAARRGRGQLAVLSGEAGIGKTRLATELRRRAAATDARVAVGAAVDVGGEAPFAVAMEVARELVRVVPVPPAQVRWPDEIGRLAPDLAIALGRRGVPPQVASPELERLRIFEAVLRLVEWAAAERPVLLVAEDAHRADRVSLQLLAHIGRRLADLPVLLVITRRDRPIRGELDALVSDLAGRGVPVTDLELPPLSAAEVAAVVRSVAPLTQSEVDKVIAAAEGSPLLAVECARAMASGSASPPPSLRAAVRAALAALPPLGRELAEVVAAAGRSLRAPELNGLGLPDLTGARRAVLDAGMLEHVDGSLGFRHALISEATRFAITDTALRHEQLASALAAGAGDASAEEVARNFDVAGRDDLAAVWWERAAHRARSIGALPEALEFWTAAIRCRPGRVEPWLELAEVHGWLGHTDEWQHAWESALAVAGPDDQPVVWCHRGRLLRGVICHPSGSVAAYRRADELVGDATPRALVAEILLGLAWGESVIGDPSAVEPMLRQVAEVLPDRPDAATLAAVEDIRLHSLIRLGRFGECEKVAVGAATLLERAHRLDFAYGVWVNAACALACEGRFAAALAMADRAVAAVSGVPVLEVPCLSARAHLLSRLDRHDEATETAGRARTIADRLDSAALAATTRHDAGLVALAAGRHAEAAELLAEALDAGAEVSLPAARLALAEALALKGDAEGATGQLRAAALAPVGPADQPLALVPRLTRVQGLIARARGDHDEARRRFAEAAQGWRRLLHRPADEGGEEFVANLLDLGRPPVVGLVEPVRELARVSAELEGMR
jgi:DNA-binding SARP family transcriptional activator/tetratricopeptide (TPR) repeat protein